MRIKKGFTLAEILIVLMVIGVIATMTVPSLMKGVNDATYKTAFKKAYNSVTNIAAVEKIAGQLPVTNDATSVSDFFASLNSNLSVKEYVEAQEANFDKNTSSESLQTTSTKSGTAVKITFGNKFESGSGTKIEGSSSTRTPWIVTEDNIAYSVIPANNGTCENKMVVNSTDKEKDAQGQACVVVVVDVNGLAKGPNKLEPQIGTLTSSSKLAMLEGDRYYIYIASDGVAAGPKGATISGRLMSDMK